MSELVGDLARPVLLEGEDPAAYNHLITKVTAAVQPDDIIEEFCVRDVVDLLWETLRLRRLKANLLSASAHVGLCVVLRPILGYSQSGPLVEQWYQRHPAALTRVVELLAAAGLTMDSVMAQTLSKKLDDIERIDRMIASSEARRYAVLRELDRHRAALATRLRSASEVIVDAEFSPALVEEEAGAVAA